jgi:uncharacterized protein YecT (DUF1311 family)
MGDAVGKAPLAFGLFFVATAASAQYAPTQYSPAPPQYATPQYAPPPQPSFDCSRATQSIERAICADPDLSVLDAKVGGLYQKALAIAADRDHVTNNQRTWIVSRNADCGKSPPNLLYECIDKSERDRANTLAAAIAEQQAAGEREKTAREDAGYQQIEIDDFILDSKSLIAGEQKIVVAGFYKKFGNIEGLYPTAQAALTSSDSAGMIYILSENAVRDIRAYFLRCDRNQYAPCPVRIRGYASTCDLTLGSLSASKPCFIVESGTTP